MTSNITDYYKILNCDKSNNIDQITAEFRHLALVHHPDKSPDPRALDSFKAINEAYHVLSDKDRKKEYDRYLSSGLDISYQEWQRMELSKRSDAVHWRNNLHNNFLQGEQHHSSKKSEDLISKFRNYDI
jgi:DnaJ-class molecular chaperone